MSSTKTRPLTGLFDGGVSFPDPLVHERFIAVFFAIFSFVTLGLAAIGLASAVAYSVEQRTGEFGVRMALDAPKRNVLLLTWYQPLELPV